MRPIQLKVKGLRSYREEQCIDFGDRTLVAVIGDTGAGKSSLLEAITFALYGVSTWEKGNRDLISDYAEVMKVDFTFSVGGGSWRVTRARRRTGAPVDRIENLDTNERVDGSKPVTTRVETLLGLDYGTFLQTVILPQGKFDTLLKSSDAERVKVLKRLFAVDALGRVRELAKERRTNAEYALDALAQARSLYRDDPVKAVETAASEAKAAVETQQAIDRAKAEARALAAAAGIAEKRVDLLADACSSVDVPGLKTAEKDAKRLAALARTAEDRVTKARLGRDGARTTRDSARGALAKLIDSGGDAATLTGLRGALGDVTKQAESLRVAIGHLRTSITEREEANAASEQAATAETAAADLLQNAAEAQRAAADQAAIARDASDRFDAAADAADEARRAVAECADAARVTEAEREKADVDLAAANTALDAAEAALDDASAERDRLQVAHALAHATADLAVGDPCPICTTVLAPGFLPLRSPSLKAAEGRVAKAAKALRDSQSLEAGASATIRELTARKKRESETTRTAERKLEEGLAELAGCSDVDVVSGPVPSAVLAKVRKTFAKTAADAEKAEDRLERQRNKAEDAWRSADKRAGEAAVRAEAKAEATTACAHTVRSQLEVLRTAIAALPSKLQPTLGSVNAKVETLQVEDVVVDDSSALAELKAREDALHAAETSASSSQDELDEAEQALENASAAYAYDVIEPVKALTRNLRSLAPAVQQVAALVKLASPVEPTSDEPGAMATWATVLLRTATKALPAAEREQAKAARDAEKQRTALERALAAAGADDLDQLEELRGLAVARAKAAADELKAAKAEISYVKELDRRLKQGKAFRDALKLLEANLTDGTFIGDLLHRRQKALLGVATVRLGEMSGGRYGFNENFEIVDRDTGQPRSTRTLSGGESFQASLAFALAMVELAGRSGSRVDALFLDEGFGSLDARNLSEALDLLEQRAESGRLITIISHVREVADRIDDVLVVTDGASGSEVHWLTRAERDRLASADVEQALSGLLG